MFLSVDVEHHYFVTLGKYLISVNLSLPVESFKHSSYIQYDKSESSIQISFAGNRLIRGGERRSRRAAALQNFSSTLIKHTRTS